MCCAGIESEEWEKASVDVVWVGCDVLIIAQEDGHIH